MRDNRNEYLMFVQVNDRTCFQCIVNNKTITGCRFDCRAFAKCKQFTTRFSIENIYIRCARARARARIQELIFTVFTSENEHSNTKQNRPVANNLFSMAMR